MIYVLLPAYNEAKGIADLLTDLDVVMKREGLSYKSLVIDDGSTDGTALAVSTLKNKCPVELIKHNVNKGLGEALKTGLGFVNTKCAEGDVVFIMDADNTHPPELIPTMIDQISAGADIVIASRFRKGAKVLGVPLYRRFLSAGASTLFKTLVNIQNVKDYTGGFRAYRAGLIKNAFTFYNGHFMTEQGFSCMIDILLKLNKLKPQCVEVPLTLYYNKKRGPSKMKIFKSIKSTLKLLHNYKFR